MQVHLLVRPDGMRILLTEFRAGKPVQTYARFSGFKRQATVKIGRNPHRDLATAVPQHNRPRHRFFVGFHVGNDLSHHLTDAFESLLWCWGQPAEAGVLDT